MNWRCISTPTVTKPQGFSWLGLSKINKKKRLWDSRTLFCIHFCLHFIVMFWKVMKFIFQISLLGWNIQFHYLICIWIPTCESISLMAYQSSSLVSHFPGAWGAGPPPQDSPEGFSKTLVSTNWLLSVVNLSFLWLSLVAFQLWRVLEQLAPEFFLIFFFKTGDLSMVQLTQKMQKSDKKW